jgi:hypothetical protein
MQGPTSQPEDEDGFELEETSNSRLPARESPAKVTLNFEQVHPAIHSTGLNVAINSAEQNAPNYS